MKFTTFTTFVYSLLVLMSLAAFGAPLESRDVYVPPVTYPRAGTVWKVGESHHVIWDVSEPPKQISNPIGEIFLRKGDFTSQTPLKDNFDILLGSIEITVPQVEDGDDYRIVLFGDSGNWSPPFSIRNH